MALNCAENSVFKLAISLQEAPPFDGTYASSPRVRSLSALGRRRIEKGVTFSSEQPRVTVAESACLQPQTLNHDTNVSHFDKSIRSLVSAHR
jgi:hypothetical protein